MKFVLIAAAASLALAAPAFADPGGHGQGHDKGHKNKGGEHYDRHGAGTPPGLAKKPGGMPPGHYKKMYNRGQRLPTTYVTQRYYVANPQAYRLRTPPAGYRWVQVDDQYYLAQTRTGLISEVVSALLR
ncbi:MAG: RcnB family protein [Phenylobacterium sp.]|uniref:RcnB family protein n=1 Tax=Phenylobacterium sp. TaxID=1871053 RepID=UPI001B67B014|nr:RcnB family protein [Phenylobacterium sp.]MBP7815529.1 RcnB family protein [Phenylobacterium sp.]MBP9756761.1 RcnB family protein [Phenylobacterium sp.]